MKVLLTGGGGFLGAWISKRLLDAGILVRVLDAGDSRRLPEQIIGPRAAELDWRVGDVREASAVLAAAEGCTAIIHNAGILTPACQQDPVKGAMINVIGTLNVFEAAKRCGIDKVIYSSSGGVYGPDDATNPWPTTHYGVFKLANEGSARAYAETAGIRSIGFRPFVIYGPGREGGLTAGPTSACRAAATGALYVIPYTGTTGMVFVEDVATAYQIAIERPFTGAHVVNLPGMPTTVDEIVTEIKAIAPGARISADGPSMPSLASPLGYRGEDILGQLTTTRLREGLEQTVQYYRANR